MFLWELAWRLGRGEQRSKVVFVGKTLDTVKPGSVPTVEPDVLIVVVKHRRVPLVLASTGDSTVLNRAGGKSWNLEFVNPDALRQRWLRPYFAGRKLRKLSASNFRATDVSLPRFVLDERRPSATQ